MLPVNAGLHFLGTNARTAEGYHGNFYFDEFFWTFKFNELNKVASGMAMQKQYLRTYFSTPSSMAHEAYTFWTGERFNKGKLAAQRLTLDVSHDNPNSVWVKDAVAAYVSAAVQMLS